MLKWGPARWMRTSWLYKVHVSFQWNMRTHPGNLHSCRVKKKKKEKCLEIYIWQIYIRQSIKTKGLQPEDNITNWGSGTVAQLFRALGYYPEGQGFKSEICQAGSPWPWSMALNSLCFSGAVSWLTLACASFSGLRKAILESSRSLQQIGTQCCICTL